MKKTVITVVSVLCLITILFGCSVEENPPVPPNTDSSAESMANHPTSDSEKKEDVLISDKDYLIQLCGFSDSIPNVTHKAEFSDWSVGTFIDQGAQKNLRLSVEKRSIDAEYINTEKKFYDFYYTHAYEDENNNSFCVTETGQLSHCFFGPSWGESKNEKIYSEVECRNIAYAFIDDIVNAGDYTIQSVYEEDQRLYRFSFTKSVSGFDCADQAEVWVEENGHIYSFSSSMLGKIPSDATVDFDVKQIQAQLGARLDQMYANAKKVFDEIQYEFVYHTVTIDEDGNYLLVCTVNVDCITKYGEVSTIMGERLRFVVQEN